MAEKLFEHTVKQIERFIERGYEVSVEPDGRPPNVYVKITYGGEFIDAVYAPTLHAAMAHFDVGAYRSGGPVV